MPISKDSPQAMPDPNKAQRDDEEDEWRHPPVAPRDEKNPLKSIGEAIADVATGSEKAAEQGRDVGKPPAR